jgi:predicted lipase
MKTKDAVRIARDSYSGKFDDKYDLIYTGGCDNTQFHILEDNYNTIITFTGSNEVKDWFTNLFVRRSRNVHRGWLKDYGEVSEVLYGYLHESRRDNLIMTSHSYGCGIHNIVALDVAKQAIFRSIELHSFGSPRTGNKDFKKEMDNYIPANFRYVNKWDVVTKVPFGGGYRHCGIEIKSPRGRHTVDDYIKNFG